MLTARSVFSLIRLRSCVLRNTVIMVELLSDTVEESVRLIADPFSPDCSVNSLRTTLEYETVSSNVNASCSEVKLRVKESRTGLVVSWTKSDASLAVSLGMIVRLNPAMS